MAAKKKRGPKAKKRASRQKKILLDVEVEDAHRAARLALINAQRLWNAHRKDCQEFELEIDPKSQKLWDGAVAVVEKTEAALEDGYWNFRMVAMSPKLYAELLSAHRPTEEQQDAFKVEVDEAIALMGAETVESEAVRDLQKTLVYNPDTFPRELFKVMIVPELDEEELDILVDPDGPFGAGEITDLMSTAIDLNTEAVTLRQ